VGSWKACEKGGEAGGMGRSRRFDRLNAALTLYTTAPTLGASAREPESGFARQTRDKVGYGG